MVGFTILDYLYQELESFRIFHHFIILFYFT